jgi:hypothetical protein
MPNESSVAALRRFPVADTHDPEIMRNTLLTHYGATSFEMQDRPNFFGRSYHARLGAASLGLCAYGAPYDALPASRVRLFSHLAKSARVFSRYPTFD